MRWAVRLTKPVLLLVSFALSTVLYLYVQIQSAPMDTDTFKLVVHQKNLAPGLLFDEEGTTVEYKADGPRDKINRLRENPQLAIAVADLKSISRETVTNSDHGVYRFTVRLSVSAPELDGVEFKQNNRLDGAVELPDTRDVKIKVEFPNPPSPGAWANYDRDSFEVNPSSVTLTGPASDIKDASLTAVVDPAEAELAGSVRVKLSIPRNLSSNPRIDAVEVHPTRRQREAYVNVNFTGHPPAGFNISNYYVVTEAGPSSTALIRGPSGIVDKTSAIDAKIDISGLKAGWTYTVVPTMPAQVALVDPPLKIRVDVEKTRR